MKMMVAAVLGVMVAGAAEFQVDNLKPRTDTAGNIVNAHQGGIVWSKHHGRYCETFLSFHRMNHAREPPPPRAC